MQNTKPVGTIAFIENYVKLSPASLVVYGQITSQSRLSWNAVIEQQLKHTVTENSSTNLWRMNEEAFRSADVSNSRRNH